MRNSRLFSLAVFCIVSLVLAVGAVACGAKEPTPAPQVAPTAQPAATPTARPAATVAVASPTALPTPAQAAAKVQYGGTLQFPLTLSIDAPDPALSNLTGTRRVMYLIYNGLVKLKPDGTVGPDLAKSWDISADGKTVTFNLQTGVKFQDGTDFNAQAVKWNYDRIFDTAVGSPRKRELTPPLESVQVVNDSTVKFVLTYPFRPLLAQLTQQAGQIVSPTAVQKLNSYATITGDFGRKPIGTGPFIQQEWAPGNYFSLVKNPNYWEKGLPYLDAIKLPIIGDRQIQFAMLRTGDVNVMEDIGVANVEIALRNTNLVVYELKGAPITVMQFKLSVKPWDNKSLRQAFGYAVDRKTFGDVLFKGRAVPVQSMVGPSFGDWYDSTVQVYDYSPQKAKQKLAEAGYPNGFTFKAICATSGIEAQECEVVQPILAQSGITMEIQTWDVVTYFSDYLAGRHTGPLVSFWSPRPDLSINLRRIFHSKGASNSWDYNNPEVDKLLEQAEAVYDIAKAKPLYNQIETMIANDAPAIFMSAYNVLYGVGSNTHGFQPIADTVPRLSELWISK